jgi:hypothetical protein
MADIPNAIGALRISEYLSTHDARALDELRWHAPPATSRLIPF